MDKIKILEDIWDRLIHVHKEGKRTDRMKEFRAVIDELKEENEEPGIEDNDVMGDYIKNNKRTSIL